MEGGSSRKPLLRVKPKRVDRAQENKRLFLSEKTIYFLRDFALVKSKEEAHRPPSRVVVSVAKAANLGYASPPL